MRYKGYVASHAGNSEKINRYNCFLNGILKVDTLAPTFYAENLDFKRRNLYGFVGAQNNYDTGEELAYIIANLLGDFLGEDFNKEYKNFFEYSNSAILSHLFEMPDEAKAVDLSVLYIEDDNATVFNMGNGPVYFFEEGKLKKVSGKTPETVEIQKKHLDEKGEVITDVIMKNNIPHLGVFDEKCETVPYKSESIKLTQNGLFMLCSKSVVDVLGEDNIVEILSDKKIAEHDKAFCIVNEAAETQPEGDFLAEIISINRGFSAGASDMRNLSIWIIVAVLCGALWLTGPFIAKHLSRWVNNMKENAEIKRIEQQVEEDQRKWIPKPSPQKPKVEEQQPNKSQESENTSEEQVSSTQSSSGTSIQTPVRVQKPPAVSTEKPGKTDENLNSNQVSSTEDNSTNTEVELPIDFN